MKKTILKHALVPLALAAAVSTTHAAQVEVTFDEPEHFSDVRATTETQARFRERVLADLGEYFREAGTSLPDEQTLAVNIRDVDLAGYVEYFHPAYPFGLRVIRDVDFPRIKLDYELRDANGEVIKSGEGNLSDLGFRFPVYENRRFHTPLEYEKRMIERWYRENFS